MAQQQHIDQGSIKYPRESARPNEAEEEGLQAAGEPPHALQQGSPEELTPSHCQRKRGRERGEGRLGAEGKITGCPSTGAGHRGSPHRHACANPGRRQSRVASLFSAVSVSPSPPENSLGTKSRKAVWNVRLPAISQELIGYKIWLVSVW